MVYFTKLSGATVVALVTFILNANSSNALSGTGKTTRYWDCCKPSCAWSGKAAVSSPVRTCDQHQSVVSASATSGCNGGNAYTCANQQPWAVSSSLAYGFAAVNIAGSSESAWCCQCYQLTFTSGSASGKTMIVQATNTGGDLGSNQFDLLIPGGGVGIYNGCNSQYGSWNGGAQYGGVSSRDQCANLPSIVQSGCDWRWDFLNGADNPTVNWQTVTCPSAITNISGCVRNDQGNNNSGGGGGGGGGGVTTSANNGGGGGGGSGVAQKYGQCGGQGWTGPTQCASGSTCKYSSAYYSQCL